MIEQEAKQLEVDMKWNGRANVCVHCGRVPETFYIVTGHDHTDDEIRWCLCRKPLTPKKSEREAELEAEVMRLRGYLDAAYKVASEHDDSLPFDWAVYCEMLWQALTPFTPTTLPELIEKVHVSTKP